MSFCRMAAKQSPPKSRMRSGKRGVVGREHQVRPLVHDELPGVGEAEQAVEAEDVLGRRRAPCARSPAGRPTCRVDRQADDAAAPAALERALEGPDEVLRLFLDLHLAVADDAEEPWPASKSRGKAVEEEQDEVLERQKRMSRAGQPDEALELGRQRQQGVEVLASVGLKSRSARLKPRLGMKGNGWAGSTASGVSIGKIRSRK